MRVVSGESATKMRVVIRHDTDILLACQKGRALAVQIGLSGDNQVAVVIAIAEVARNILRYAGHGEIALGHAHREDKEGVVVIARDDGPGIPNVEMAMQDGYSTGGGLGSGLPGAKRLMDEFEIFSRVGDGTIVTMRKW